MKCTRIISFAFLVFFFQCTFAQSDINSANWRFTAFKDFEQQDPGLGVGYEFVLGSARADIFFYGLQREWREGIDDPKIAQVMDQSSHDVFLAERLGYYKDVYADPAKVIVIAGKKFWNQAFKYFQNGVAKISKLYLTGMNGKLLKYRISAPVEMGPEFESSSNQLIEYSLTPGTEFDRPWLSKK